MSSDGGQLTKTAYEDQTIVQGYIQRNALKPRMVSLINSFAQTIDGHNLLDLGCGPGQDSYLFAQLGFAVTGLDYSHEMIRRAQTLEKRDNKPTFVVGDMRKLPEYFDTNSFDAIWACSSMIHLEPVDMPQALQGITEISKSGAKIMISLREGEGTQVVNEDKLGKPMQREFTFWHKDSFLKQVEPFSWQLDDFFVREGSLFMGKPSQWLTFFFTVKK